MRSTETACAVGIMQRHSELDVFDAREVTRKCSLLCKLESQNVSSDSELDIGFRIEQSKVV